MLKYVKMIALAIKTIIRKNKNLIHIKMIQILIKMSITLDKKNNKFCITE